MNDTGDGTGAEDALARARRGPTQRSLLSLTPVVTALAYPFVLAASRAAFVEGGSFVAKLWASLLLAAAFALPLHAFAVAAKLGRIVNPSCFEIRARRLAFAAATAPPLFVLTGVARGLLAVRTSEALIWSVGWLAALAYAVLARDNIYPSSAGRPGHARVVQGIVAAILLTFITFHLSNHLAALTGPTAHAQIMEAGRAIYRSRVGEAVLIALLMLQIALGTLLARHWTGTAADIFRSIQVGTGIYVGVFVLTHLNSALISARAVRGIATDWAWATGAPSGLLLDAWNIRLLPHYTLGVLFTLVHLATGARFVMLAHGVGASRADRLWACGTGLSILVAVAITGALLGARI